MSPARQALGLDDGHSQAFRQVADRLQPFLIDVAGYNLTAVIHAFGHVGGLAAGGRAQIQDAHAGLRVEGGRHAGCRRILNAEPALRVAGQVADGDVLGQPHRFTRLPRLSGDVRLPQGGQERR